jgi:lactate racemase
MYKLEPVVADGGELIIYGKHIKEVSVTHGALIKKIGYHVRDYFTAQMDRFRDIPGGILAHSTHVRGMGTFENGIERPRVTVTLATAIPEAECREICLGYRDPDSIDPEAWRDREDEGLLLVPDAGEILYHLSDRRQV